MHDLFPSITRPARRLGLLSGVALGGLLASASPVPAQDLGPGRFTVIPATRLAPVDSLAERFNAAVSPTPLPTFTYTLTGYDSLTYSGSIVGRSPLNRGKTTTTIPTQIVPLVITIGGVTYDPTQPDACVTGNPTDVSIIVNSPIFTNNAWTMNAIPIGNTQYIDAFQRAQFWSLVQGTPYHLVLQQSTLAKQALTLSGSNHPQTCGSIGVVDINTFDAAVQALITGPLAGTVNVGTFPIFLTKDVVESENGNCCILGYHSGLIVGGNLQIYSPFAIDTTGLFGAPDVEILSHEMGEAINDPAGNNPTPLWGQIGQVFNPNPPPDACQSNFEVGDPLTPGGPPPGSVTFVVGGYHLQELAFYSWFYGSTALGVGAGGKFSDNGTFGGHAKPCPPGGTN
jgi:hypothetical protein